MKKRNKSIVQPDMTSCFICGKTGTLHTHEVFFGTADRIKSIDHGLYIKLCPFHHTISNNSVHLNKAVDLKIKKYAQMKFEEKYSKEKFMEVFHKDYLWDEVEDQ